MEYNKIIEAIRALADNKKPDLSEVESLEFSKILFNHKCYYLLSKIKSGNKLTKLSQATLMMNKATIRERFSSLRNIFDLLNISGIHYAVIKGAILSQHTYGNYYYRKSSDIDLLVDRNQIEKVKGILFAEGFIQGRILGDMIIPYSRKELLYHTAFTHQTAPFVKKTDSKTCPFINVDINTNIMWGESNVQIDIADLLKDASNVIFLNNYFIKTLPVFKEFISLCLHHYKDMNSIYLINNGSLNLSLFGDIFYYILNNFDCIDTDELLKLCEKLGVRDYIYYCIYYTNMVFADERLNKFLNIFKTQDSFNILNRLGLDRTEYRQWNIDFYDRLFNSRFHEIYKSLLTEKDLNKIDANSMM